MIGRLPDAVRSAMTTWLAVHDHAAPGVVEGLYLVGSAALDDWQPRSDVDIVAFVADPTDADVISGLEAAHLAFRSDPGLPVVDGPFLAWADVSSPPLAMQRPWSLDGDFRFDGECFEINPVTWSTLSTRGVAVRGPVPDQLEVALDADERRRWVRDNVDTYWRGVLRQVQAALDSEPDREEFDAAILEWCALGIARMAFTGETALVTSKTGAGVWAIERYPTHQDVLSAAIAVRCDAHHDRFGRAIVEGLVALLSDLVRRITVS